VHHLLTVQEMYQEGERDEDDEAECLHIPKKMMPLDDMIRYMAKAGYEVRKRTRGAGGQQPLLTTYYFLHEKAGYTVKSTIFVWT